MQWSPLETITANINQGLTHGGTVSKDPFSERELKALNISMKTNTESDKVLALTFPAEKNVQGYSSKLIPLKDLGWKSVQLGHSDQFLN